MRLRRSGVVLCQSCVSGETRGKGRESGDAVVVVVFRRIVWVHGVLLHAPTGIARTVPPALVDDRELHGLQVQYGHPASAYATRCGAPGRQASSVCRSRGVAVSGRGGGRCDARRWRPTGQSVILHRIACMSRQQGGSIGARSTHSSSASGRWRRARCAVPG